MSDKHYSFLKQIYQSKEIDNVLKNKDAIPVGARTYFRSKYNTYKFLKNIGVKTPKLYAHYSPLKDHLELDSGFYFCKPEFGWGSKGIFNLEVKNNKYYIDNYTFPTIKEVFQNKEITHPYIIEERAFNLGDDNRDKGITDIKFYCFQNNTAPLCLVVNRTKKLLFWLNEKAEIVHAGIPSKVSGKYLENQLHISLAKYSKKAFNLLRLLNLEKRRVDFFKLCYNQKRAKRLKEKIFHDMEELSDEMFFEIQNKALSIMQKIPLSFCRIDFFNSTDGILVNELTPIPGDTKLFYPEYDYLLGKQLHESKIIFKNKFYNGYFNEQMSVLGHDIVYE